MKKRLLSLFAAAAITLSLSACKPSETAQKTQTSETAESTAMVSETVQTAETTAPESSDVIYETLAEGQERDWKIEDVLKNDLEIDGIPISIPCTVEELLNTLGDEYSIDETNLKDANAQEHHVVPLVYKDNETMLTISVATEKDLNYMHFLVDGVFFTNLGYENGVLFFRTSSDSYSEFISKYTYPSELEIENNKILIKYDDGTHYLDCIFRDNDITMISIGIKIEENENE